MEGLTLHHAVTKCWTAQVLPRIKPIMQALPSCIAWELWKRRNNRKYGKAVTVSRHVPNFNNTSITCASEKARAAKGWIKVNTDSASRKNSGRNAIGFCLRNENGDVRYAFDREINEATNTEAEALAVVEALSYCREYNYTQIWLQTDS
ncbi:uncharacterized protein [Nicotiana tomentosiformis]|uniref:uncharacterized protein n=1 Tax=Nicotiana tomentosiformis TaxID=4098 RepID=UPI00051B89B4|nr:uncharacterized protein LOC104102917 [Nicotiana tomentosiformis]